MTEHFNNCPVLIRKPQVGGSIPLAGSRNFSTSRFLAPSHFAWVTVSLTVANEPVVPESFGSVPISRSLQATGPSFGPSD